jgi:hypothetical protein
MAKKPSLDNPFAKRTDFFKVDLKNDKLRKSFASLYEENAGDWTRVKAALKEEEGFTPDVVRSLEFTHRLATWSNDNEALISAFQKDDTTNSTRDIALNFSKAAFVSKVMEVVPGDNEEEKRMHAANLHNGLFHIEPTAMLVNMVKDTKVPMLNDAVGAGVARVLENKPDFNIRTTSVYELLASDNVFSNISEDSKGAITTQLKTLQRITALSPVPDAIPALYNARLHTALQISEIPETQFMMMMSDKGLDETSLKQIHANAAYSRARIEHALMALREAGKETGVAMIDKSLNSTRIMNEETGEYNTVKMMKMEEVMQEVIEKNNLSWDLLFGDADFCECGECTSVYSAASYYVELLQYLRNNNLDPNNPNTGLKTITGTPVEKLFKRRPDLGCLQLTCENTNTILPYIDLVNEVMENYVAFKALKPFNTHGETSGELLAEPQNTEYQAYCILKKAVYPFSLPYHQPIDAIRIYLNYLETSRHELIKTFRKNNENADAVLTELKDLALDRAVDAEYLGITKEEYVILTKQCFETKALIDKLKNKIHTEEEYREMMGVKPVHKYYGYDDEATMLGSSGLILIKDEFLRRTGINYVQLVDMLLTCYVNPRLPKGKAKVVMDSLRFSYRFLQMYAQAYGLDKMAEDLVKMEKLADLFPVLKEFLDNLRKKEGVVCPDPNDDKPEITDKDIIHWVKCHFEKIGKIIVIESGQGCVNGEILYKGQKAYRMFIKDCRIIMTNSDHLEIELGHVDKHTGKLTFSGDDTDVNHADLKELLFVSEEGEKGLFILIGEDVYLIMARQKDNCDLDSALLQHLDGTALTTAEYDRIHRFIRLWRKLGWTMDEVDSAIMGLSLEKTTQQPAGEGPAGDDSICADCDDECASEECDECEDCNEDHCLDYDINPLLIHQLVAVKKLLGMTGLELVKLLTFWNTISTSGKKSLYTRLFLTHNVRHIDPVFKADGSGNYMHADEKITDHIPVLMAALNLRAEEIKAIMTAAMLEDKLTLTNVSMLYRYRLLSKILGLRIDDFIKVLPLFGDVFKRADATLTFMKRWARMTDAGITYQQLNYIIRGVDDERRPFAPTQKTVLLLAKNLYDGLNAIDKDHPGLSADEGIDDPVLEEINIQEKATSEMVRGKASFLFDSAVVEMIIAMLEGTTAYATNAPKNLSVVVPGDKMIARKLQYDATAGSIQITGILTAAEKVDFIGLSNNPDWTPALTRIEKQQAKMFKELLSGIFENNMVTSDVDKLALEAVIKSGDISIPLDQIPDGEADTNTAPKKRVAFLTIYIPYLRQELTRRFIVNTLAGFAGLELDITDALLTKVLHTAGAPLFDVFKKIKESEKPDEANWEGYLVPPATSNYILVIKDSNAKPVVSIDERLIDFEAQEDPTNEWWSTSVELQAGKLYKLEAVATELKNIFWKTPASAVTPVPTSLLIPDFASQQCEPALLALKKAAMLVTAFEMSEAEVSYVDFHKADFDNLDFNALTLAHWLRLEAYVRLRNSLPETDFSILDFWKWINYTATDATLLSEKIADLTNWDKARVDKMIAPGHFNISDLEDFRNEKNLLKLQKAMTVTDRIGMDVDLLFDWAVPTSKFNKCRTIADSIRHAIRAKYNQTDWEQVVKPLHDELRNHQKEALIAYLLQQPELLTWGVTDANSLFEYFLIDVRMDACMETSRIKQAISSVQLFVQRCFLGLESGIGPEVLDRKRWEWMQRYRVWEANRKVFLYPENWIETDLRDDKSPFYKELESELLQNDVNKDNVVNALKSYLYKVDEVANLQVVGLYIEGTRTSGTWSEDAKLHIFGRTRNAAYIFYYRYLSLSEMNWYPWEKLQVDVPSYDEFNDNGDVVGNGCYLTPVVWNGRLLIFFPQIMKKTRPADTGSKSFETLGSESAANLDPIEYFEVKMAFSEYRNKKWTQKQASAKSVSSDPVNNTNDIQYFKFVPIVYNNRVLINFDDNLDSDGGFKGAFEFDGTAIKVANAAVTSAIPIDYFNEDDGRMYSWQISQTTLARQYTDIYFNEVSAKETFQGLSAFQSKFSNPYTNTLLGKINMGKLDQFFAYNGSVALDDYGAFDHDSDSGTPNIYHELKRPNALYHWEQFFHTPVALADALSKSQQYEEAMKWYHYVFNPMAEGSDDKRFWAFTPFKEIDSKKILNAIFNNLQANEPDQTINEWREKPFMPHVMARSRPVAYMKWVVMKYIDNLIAWGDYLFRQDTIETINQATQLYILAWHILGQRPRMIPKRGKVKPQTYLGLLNKWDAFGNAVVELELAAPFSNQTPLPIGAVNGEIAFANIFGLASTLYFCIPNNPKLMGYWDTIDDRLYKIRHCLNIEGVFRKLPLFEPPIDPALLVKAAAQGLSIASVLNDLNTPMPNYRFYYLLQKAIELCVELKTMGNALLSAMEKIDGEAMSLLRARHERTMQNLVMEVKKQQLEEAQKNLESLRQNRKGPEAKMKYFLQLSGLDESLIPGENAEFNGIPNTIVTVDGESGLKLIPFEKEDMTKARQAQDKQLDAALPEKIASIMHIIPNFSVNIQPFGCGASISFGGSNLGAAAQAWAKFLQLDANELTYASTSAGKKANFTRALQDRIYQASAAGFEIKQIDKQMLTQQIRIAIANQEIANQQKAIDHAAELEDFIRSKYSNDELYNWMKGSLKTLYHQVYALAYELGKKAERVFRFERGLSSTNFLQSGYWEAGRDGLLSGERLYVALKQMEAAYQGERGYDYEIVKHVSLRQVNPMALIQLRETGRCEFSLPEIFFDMDYPGHYNRRVKTVSVSIPCVVGPYTSVNATLRLLENKFRNTALSGSAYPENTEEDDARFTTSLVPINAIAASGGQNDTGLFELNFKDERYLPFEGAGVISKWRLELPELRQFDYANIADVLVDLRYTSAEGGERLKKAASETVNAFVKSNEELAMDEGLFAIVDLQHDLPTEWHKAVTIPDGQGNYVMDLNQLDRFIPYYLYARKQSLKVTDLVLVSDGAAEEFMLDDMAFNAGVKVGSLSTASISGESLAFGNWKLRIPDDARDSKALMLILRMKM